MGQTITALIAHPEIIKRPVSPTFYQNTLHEYEDYRAQVLAKIYCNEKRAFEDDIFPGGDRIGKLDSRTLIAETLDFTKHKLAYLGTDSHYLRCIQNDNNDVTKYDFKTRCGQLRLYCQQVEYHLYNNYKCIYDSHYAKVKYVMEIDDVNGTCQIFREAQRIKPNIGCIAENLRNILYGN